MQQLESQTISKIEIVNPVCHTPEHNRVPTDINLVGKYQPVLVLDTNQTPRITEQSNIVVVIKFTNIHSGLNLCRGQNHDPKTKVLSIKYALDSENMSRPPAQRKYPQSKLKY